MRSTCIVRIACLALLCLSTAGCLGLRRGPVVVWIPPVEVETDPEVTDGPCEPPPPPRVEERPRAPSNGHVWIAGHWGWRGGRYVWVSGHWLAPARHGALWVSGHWHKSGNRYLWVEGHWR